MEIDWVLAGKVIWALCLATWAVIRWVPNRRARKVKIAKTTRTPSERLAMVLSSLGLGVIPAIWVFTGQPSALDHATNPVLVIIGLVIFLASLRLFRITHKALGAMWSHSLDLRENHKLVTQGIYERVRHPMYSAFWLWAVAQPFLLSNWIAGLSGSLGFGALFFMRLGQEERMMEERFGQDYRDYCARTKRIIPSIW
ncbi:MAG: protein-S-isoprenylcysteine O-methyltransferase [Nitratireductor sp.]